MSTAIAISRDKKLAKTLRAGLLKGVTDVTTAASVDALDNKSGHRLAAVHVDDDAAEQIRDCLGCVSKDAQVIVIAAKSDLGAFARALQTSPQVAAVMTTARADHGNTARAARGMSEGGVFGLRRFLGDDDEIKSAVLTSYADKLACLDQLERFAKSHQIRAKYREAMLQSADEMLMNALYIAPREVTTADGGGKQTLRDLAQRRVQVEYAYAGDTLWVAVRDYYGSVDRDRLLRQWKDTLDAHEDASNTDDHALGLYIMSNASTSVHLALAPGVASEFVCSFDTRAAKLKLQEFEIVEETDAARIKSLKATRDRAPETTIAGTGEEAQRSSIMWLVAVLAVIVVVLVIALALS